MQRFATLLFLANFISVCQYRRTYDYQKQNVVFVQKSFETRAYLVCTSQHVCTRAVLRLVPFARLIPPVRGPCDKTEFSAYCVPLLAGHKDTVPRRKPRLFKGILAAWIRVRKP